MKDDYSKELMAKVALGDHEAFGALVLRHQDRVFRVAYRYLGNRMEAEDMAQETFVRVFEAASRYRPRAPFPAYLLKITTNLCLNRKARLYRRLEKSLDPANQVLREQPAGGPTPEEEVLRAERASAVRGAVLALPDDQRMALILFRFEELSYDAVAESMGKPVSAVSSLIWRARETLRKELHGWVNEAAPQGRHESPVRESRRKRR